MDKSYFNTDRNITASVKPSRTNSWFLMVLFLGLLWNSFVANAATITSTVTGNWSAATTWSAVSRVGTISTTSGSINVTGVGTSFLTELAVGSVLKTTGGVPIGTVASITSNTALTLVANATVSYSGITYTAQVVPKASDDVVISSGITVITTADAFANSISVYGILTINHGNKLTVYGNVNVASGAQFNAGTGNNDCATIIVYGNFINYGFADFWKSTVVIASDLVTVSTILQNNGNIIVGGNVSGVIGGSGSGIVYPVNTNATVNVTGSADEKPPGTLPTSNPLLDLTNEVVYGGSCTFTINNIASFSACSGSNAVFTVSTNGISPTYQWQVNTNGSGWVDLVNNATYTGVSIATLTITGVSITMNSYKYRAKITAGSPTTCTKNGNYGVLTVNTTPAVPTITVTAPTCSSAATNVLSTYDASLTYTSSPTGLSVGAGGVITGGNNGTSYTIRATNTSSCFATSASFTYNGGAILSTPAVPTIVVTAPTCSSAATNVLSTYDASLTYTSTPTGLSVGAGGVITGGTNGTSYTIRATNTSSCFATSASFTYNGGAILSTPAVPTITTTQPSCSIATGTITVTAPTTGISYTITGTSPVVAAVTNAMGLFSVLAAGNYNVTSTDATSGCISAPVSSTINTFTPVTKTWDGTSWSSTDSSTTAPTSNDLVIINGNYTITKDNPVLNACSLTINAGKLEVEAGTSVIIQNDLTVNANATLDVLDKGSLVMVNDSGTVTNNGTTSIHRFTTPFKLYDYVYWSTPVSATNIADTFQTKGWNTNHAYKYIPGGDWSFASSMSPGEGCIIMVPTPTSGPGTNNPSEVIFSGKVNNGIYKITGVIPDSSYLLGNPYPSAINADEFLEQNKGVLDGTLYFWTHNTAIQLATSIKNGTAGSGAYAFTSDDYATYNSTGGVAVATGNFVNGVQQASNKPNGKIASGQGFFGSSNAAIVGINEIVYNNSMRLAGTTSLDNKTGVNEQFFRTSSSAKAKTASVLEKHRIWLDLKNSQGAFKQTLVGYISGATNDYDSRFDGESYDGNDFVDFYSIIQDKNLTIQGRAVPFDENDTVPLGFKTTIEGSFTINIDQVDGLLTNQAVYLEDKVTNTLTNLKTGDYTFTTATGTFDDRFVLRYTDKTLGLNDMDKADGILVFYSNNYKTLIIKNNVMDATVNSVALFNTTGQRIANFDIKDSGQTNLQIPIKNIASGIYIVKVKTTKGESSKKVIVN